MQKLMSYSNTKIAPEKDFETDLLEKVGSNFVLVVWNDEVNTFDWVIETLVEVCGHSHEQAEQCALIIHTKGKYGVKEGDFEMLQPMCTAICDRLIQATIEETVQ
jgi:ATP-dependent Clp protease adaptor protein ClpS